MRDKPLSNENKVSQMAIYAVKNGCTVITTKESPHIGIGSNNVQPPFLPIAFLFFFLKGDLLAHIDHVYLGDTQWKVVSNSPRWSKPLG